MSMVALDAPRKKIVSSGSLEARWMVEEGEVSDYLKDAKKHPLMQKLMADQAEQRIEDEKESAQRLAEDRARRAVRV